MDEGLSRRTFLQTAGLAAPAAAATGATAVDPAAAHAGRPKIVNGWIVGKYTGAQALTLALLAECVDVVFGIPGAQENELWDAFKSYGLDYLLTTHEFSASCMADGYARATGKVGVVSVVPGPGLTNTLTGLGEAKLDGVPVVALVGDVARGAKYRPFQVHEMDQAALLRPVCKEVISVCRVGDIVAAVRHAFQVARCGEPGPVGVVVPYNLLLESHKYQVPPPAPPALAYDTAAVDRALALLACKNRKIGVYAGGGCMEYGHLLAQLACLLQAPVATSVSGKGVLPENHPLSVGWGYGPQATVAAEKAFKHVDLVLALGVKFNEVSTGFYSLPEKAELVHVDANEKNLGRVMQTTLCVHSDAGLFLQTALERADQLRRGADAHLVKKICNWKADEAAGRAKIHSRCGVDPMAFVLALRKATCDEALVFVDVTMSEHWAAEAFEVRSPRTYFNPT
ncbi:MAG: thiamine pyrophosphate-binding protein, partial [Planctomycetia bacterium]